jgi:endonuclease G
LGQTHSSYAALGESDSFFFTNCAPQHKDFNQQLWLSLVDYLLDNGQTRGFEASVFTGPVFSDDEAYRGVYLPTAYWKVALMIDDTSGRLSATGYVVSQANLITSLEFVHGQMRTYQVAVRYVETLTGLRFGTLRRHDPIRDDERRPIRALESHDELAL